MRRSLLLLGALALLATGAPAMTSATDNIAELEYCGNQDTCASGMKCIANKCIANDAATTLLDGQGGRCSASLCCTKPGLECIAADTICTPITLKQGETIACSGQAGAGGDGGAGTTPEDDGSNASGAGVMHASLALIAGLAAVAAMLL